MKYVAFVEDLTVGQEVWFGEWVRIVVINRLEQGKGYIWLRVTPSVEGQNTFVYEVGQTFYVKGV